MRVKFVRSVLTRLLEDGALKRSHSLLAVCAGPAENEMFRSLGFTCVVLTNISVSPSADDSGNSSHSYRWEPQNAEGLTYPDNSFDFAFVCDGLHHCSSPHKALTELYRVARVGIIVCESRDSAIQRCAVAVGLSMEYEVDAVVDNRCESGGLNNTEIPNFIYRWTEREFEKTIKTFSPLGQLKVRFFHGLEPPAHPLGPAWKRTASRVAGFAMSAITLVFPKQRNLLALIALKPNAPEGLHTWLCLEDGRVRFNPEGAGIRGAASQYR